MAGFDFEPEITFPAHPFDAARVYLGVLAYPERGAGQPGGLGVAFGEALWSHVVWNGRKARGLGYVRDKFGDTAFKPPAKRDFEGAYMRGWRRLRRRAAAYSLVGTQLINGFFAAGSDAARLAAAGRAGDAYHFQAGATIAPLWPELWVRNTPSPRRVVSRDLKRWAKAFGLNVTGDPADAEQKVKDLVRRAFLQSRPVLHMAHGLNQAVTEVGPTLDGWEEWDPLLVLLWNPDAWVWRAVENARTWRMLSARDLTPQLAPEQMIGLELAYQKYAE